MIQEYYKGKIKLSFRFDRDLYKIDNEHDCLILGRRIKDKSGDVVLKKTIPLGMIGQIKNENTKKDNSYIRNPLTGY